MVICPREVRARTERKVSFRSCWKDKEKKKELKSMRKLDKTIYYHRTRSRYAGQGQWRWRVLSP